MTPATNGFVTVARVGEIPVGSCKVVRIDDQSVFHVTVRTDIRSFAGTDAVPCAARINVSQDPAWFDADSASGAVRSVVARWPQAARLLISAAGSEPLDN